MDLSKAYDCTLHDLLIAKPHAYALGIKAIKLLHSYLRKQRAKIKNSFSEWLKFLTSGKIFRLPLLQLKIVNDNTNMYSLFHGFWQSFVTIRSYNHLMRIISTYVGNTKKSEIS